MSCPASAVQLNRTDCRIDGWIFGRSESLLGYVKYELLHSLLLHIGFCQTLHYKPSASFLLPIFTVSLHMWTKPQPFIVTHLPPACWSGEAASAGPPLCCWRQWRTLHSEKTAAAPSLPPRSSCLVPPPPGSLCLLPSLGSTLPLCRPRGAVFRGTSGPVPPGDPTSWHRSDGEGGEESWKVS